MCFLLYLYKTFYEKFYNKEKLIILTLNKTFNFSINQNIIFHY